MCRDANEFVGILVFLNIYLMPNTFCVNLPMDTSTQSLEYHQQLYLVVLSTDNWRLDKN